MGKHVLENARPDDQARPAGLPDLVSTLRLVVDNSKHTTFEPVSAGRHVANQIDA